MCSENIAFEKVPQPPPPQAFPSAASASDANLDITTDHGTSKSSQKSNSENQCDNSAKKIIHNLSTKSGWPQHTLRRTLLNLKGTNLGRWDSRNMAADGCLSQDTRIFSIICQNRSRILKITQMSTKSLPGWSKSQEL